jgi:hypothetical protein
MASGKETNIESQKGYRDEFDAMRGKEAGIMQDGNGTLHITEVSFNVDELVKSDFDFL